MNKSCTLAFVGAVLFLIASTPVSSQETVKLTTLEWPPYSGYDLYQQGASIAVAKAAFEAAGYQLEVEMLPWGAAMDEAQNNPEFVGYFPEYYSEERAQKFHFSNSIGDAPLGFAERTDWPISWTTLSDLEGFKIGTVAGYANTDEFDQRVEEGDLDAQPAPNDATNLRKVAGTQIPLAVIDQNVMNYLLSDEEEQIASSISFNDRLLEEKQLFVAFRKDERGREMAEALNRGLEQIDVERIMQDTFEEIVR